MLADDLSAPLGQGRASKRRGNALAISVLRALVASLSPFLLVLVGWAMLADNPFGSEPKAIVPAELTPTNLASKGDETGTRADDATRYDAAPGEATLLTAASGGKTITIIDGTSGNRQEVVIPASGSRPTLRQGP